MKIIPPLIPESSVKCEGHWSVFNLTWEEVKINHGNIFYEVSVQIENGDSFARVILLMIIMYFYMETSFWKFLCASKIQNFIPLKYMS